MRLALAITSGLGFLRRAEAAEAADARPPNIVFILCDDLGVNDLHCYGRKDRRTPNLDRLVGQGTRFTSAYCGQPIRSLYQDVDASAFDPLHATDEQWRQIWQWRKGMDAATAGAKKANKSKK